MSKLFAVALVAAVVTIVGLTPAEARGGCGFGRHHGPLGVCVDNSAGRVVVAPRGAVVVAPSGRVCPLGWHRGPFGHCRRN
jgi:hypothetical protein